MSQNKITVLIGNQKLFDTLSEIITIINNQIKDTNKLLYNLSTKIDAIEEEINIFN